MLEKSRENVRSFQQRNATIDASILGVSCMQPQSNKSRLAFEKKCESFCLTFRFGGILSFGMRKFAQANRVAPMDTKFVLLFLMFPRCLLGDSSFGTHDFQVSFIKFRSCNWNFKGPQSRWPRLDLRSGERICLCKPGIGSCVT